MCQLSIKGHQLTFWIGKQKSFSTPSKTYTLLPRTDTMSRLMDGKGVLIYVHKQKILQRIYTLKSRFSKNKLTKWVDV